jgi:hypothetical protein
MFEGEVDSINYEVNFFLKPTLTMYTPIVMKAIDPKMYQT